MLEVVHLTLKVPELRSLHLYMFVYGFKILELEVSLWYACVSRRPISMSPCRDQGHDITKAYRSD